MLAYTLFGTLPGFKLATYPLANAQLTEHDKSWITKEAMVLLPGQDIILPESHGGGHDFVVSLARRADLTWIGLYCYMPGSNSQRSGYFYGVGIWLGGAVVKDKKLLGLLISIVRCLKKLLPEYPGSKWSFSEISDEFSGYVEDVWADICRLSVFDNQYFSQLRQTQSSCFVDYGAKGWSIEQALVALQLDPALGSYSRVYLASNASVLRAARAPLVSGLMMPEPPRLEVKPLLPEPKIAAEMKPEVFQEVLSLAELDVEATDHAKITKDPGEDRMSAEDKVRIDGLESNARRISCDLAEIQRELERGKNNGAAFFQYILTVIMSVCMVLTTLFVGGLWYVNRAQPHEDWGQRVGGVEKQISELRNNVESMKSELPGKEVIDKLNNRISDVDGKIRAAAVAAAPARSSVAKTAASSSKSEKGNENKKGENSGSNTVN